MLHLDTGVHLYEVKLSFRREDKFYCTGIDVSGRLGRRHRRRPHLFPQLGGEGLGGGFLQHLLVAPLDGAVPLPQLDDIALPIGHDLELDVAGVDDELFQVHLVAAKAGDGLAACLLEQRDELVGLVDPAHAPSAAAGGGLDEHGIAHGVGQGLGLLGGVHRSVRAGHHRHPGLLHQLTGGGLVAHVADDVPGGADEGDARLSTGVGKVGVLRQKAIPGVEGVTARLLSHGENGVHI